MSHLRLEIVDKAPHEKLTNVSNQRLIQMKNNSFIFPVLIALN